MDQDSAAQTINSTPSSVSHDTFSRCGPMETKDYLGLYLPSYNGPNDVGTLTLELPISPPYSSYKLSSPMKKMNSNGQHILELNNSLVTIFYPVDPRKLSRPFKSIFNPNLLKINKEPRLAWITLAQIKGYLRFAAITFWKRWIIIPLALLAIGATKLPTRGSAPILLKSKTHHQRTNDHREPEIKEITNNAQNNDDKKERYKLVIFSHGLTGNRTCYSQLCGNLASQGYVVAALEHRDGTGSHSIANSITEGKIESKEIPYIDMCDVTEETRPENYLFARAFQLELRTLELLACSKWLSRFKSKSTSDSEGWKFIRDSNLRIRNSGGWAGDDGLNWSDDQWSNFADSVQWDRDVTIAGHSFGAATVIAAARHENRPKEWNRFILYDPWIETFKYISEKFKKELKRDLIEDKSPYLVINSPGFTDWKDHFEQLQLLFSFSDQNDNGKKNQSSVSYLITTLGGIIHSSFSDLPVVAEWIWKKTKKLKLDSQKAIKIIGRLTIEFIEFPINEPIRGNENGKELIHANSLETFIHQHNISLKNHHDVEQGSKNQTFSESLQPGNFFIHSKKGFS